jgi:hypothetical protein
VMQLKLFHWQQDCKMPGLVHRCSVAAAALQASMHSLQGACQGHADMCVTGAVLVLVLPSANFGLL